MKTALAIVLASISLALVPVLTPCATEDATMCNWNASTQGNGVGTSFISLTDSFTISY